MEKPLFLSFVVPVYNAEKHLEECLHSLCCQDIENYEIICINDGSTDSSLKILRRFAETASNIVIIDKENGGVATARNAGVEVAQGRYIWFIDADDFIKENTLSRLERFADETDCDKLIVGGYEFTDEMTADEQELARQNGLPINTSWHDAVVWRSLLRRSFLLEHEVCFRYPDITHGEDGLYMYEVTLARPVCEEIPEVLYFYRVHSGSVSTVVSSENCEKKLHSYIRIVQILQQSYNEGHTSAYTANKLMTFLWFSLYEAARLPAAASHTMMNEIKAAELFPYHRLPECTLSRSYMIDRTDWIGRLFDKVYLNMHTRSGFFAMRLLQLPVRIIRHMRHEKRTSFGCIFQNNRV